MVKSSSENDTNIKRHPCLVVFYQKQGPAKEQTRQSDLLYIKAVALVGCLFAAWHGRNRY